MFNKMVSTERFVICSCFYDRKMRKRERNRSDDQGGGELMRGGEKRGAEMEWGDGANREDARRKNHYFQRCRCNNGKIYVIMQI